MTLSTQLRVDHFQIHPSHQSIWMTTMKNELKCLALGIAGRQDERQVTTETEKVAIFLGVLYRIQTTICH